MDSHDPTLLAALWFLDAYKFGINSSSLLRQKQYNQIRFNLSLKIIKEL